MDTGTFIALLKQTHSKLLSLSNSKGKEYAGSDDRLANFKRLGDELNMIPEKALWVYLKKHLDSLTTYIKDQETGFKREYSEPITGRVDDAILYLHLLKALIHEREGIPVTTPEMVAKIINERNPILDDIQFTEEGGPARVLKVQGDRMPPSGTMVIHQGGSISSMQREIAEWADKVFPARTPHGSLSKLVLEEIPEFITSKMKDPHEYADLVIMILDIAHLQGIDVEQAVHEKMAINRGRNWKMDPGTGFMSHVSDEDIQQFSEEA